MSKEKVFIVIPAFNEEKTIGRLLQKLFSLGYKNIIVVNDASTDKTAEIATHFPVKLYSHVINRGLGGALRTGFAAALNEGAEVAVTIDADLQHKPEEIERLVKPILKKEAEVVLGTRKIDRVKMPLFRRLANALSNWLTHLLFGLKVSDSQSGFRAFRREALEKMRFYSSRMEISSEIVKEIARLNLSLKEVPISTVYTSYSLSKGQSLKNGLKTLARLLAIKFQR
ncbi:glycosyltransferase family 2 protein [bacterium]|nr:glycosyltransferase family 2 protein [bacterium]